MRNHQCLKNYHTDLPSTAETDNVVIVVNNNAVSL